MVVRACVWGTSDITGTWVVKLGEWVQKKKTYSKHIWTGGRIQKIATLKGRESQNRGNLDHSYGYVQVLRQAVKKQPGLIDGRGESKKRKGREEA